MSTKTESEKNAGCYLAILGLVMTAPAAVWRGWVLTKMWAWFIVPVFDLQPLRIPVAIGLSLIVGYLTHQINWCKDEAEPMEKAARSIVVPLLLPAFTLLGGWIVNHWM